MNDKTLPSAEYLQDISKWQPKFYLVGPPQIVNLYMKILHAIHSASGGGAEKQLDILCRHITAYNIDSLTLCSECSLQPNDRVRSYRTFKRKNKFDLRFIGDLNRVFSTYAPNIVHVWLPPIVTIPMLILAKSKSIPAVYSYRNTKKIRNILDLVELLVVFMCASGIVSNTKIEACSIPYRLLYLLKKGVYIPNAIEDKYEDNGEDSSSYNSQSDDRVLNLVYVGRIEIAKNIQDILGALAICSEKIDVRLDIYGEGSLLEEMIELTRSLGVDKVVSWRGYEDMRNIPLDQYDAITLASSYEGFPNVLLESMQSGLPAIISDIPAHKLLIEDAEAVLFFPMGDCNELAKRMIEISENKEVAEGLSRQSIVFAGRFTPEKMTTAYSSYYHRLFGSS